MATEVIEGTKAEIDEIVGLDAVEAGLPKPGQPIGSGLHSPISKTPGNGWTLRRVEATPSDNGKSTLDVDIEIETLPAKLVAKGNTVAADKVTAKLASKKPKKAEVAAALKDRE